jgi:CRP/FNR family cyclic AMP-dependent transcriptional regulator
MDSVLAGLLKIPFFSEVAPQTLAALAAKSIQRTYPKHAVIINEGDEAGSLFVILSGRVRVFLGDTSGKEVTLSVQERGSYFGELSLLDDEPRSASVMTLDKTVCGVIAKAEFRQWLTEHPDVAPSLLKGLTRRVRVLTESVRGLALCDVYGRLSRLLCELADQGSEPPRIPDRPSHQELANRIGSSREMVSKIMKDLVNGGYVVLEGRSLTIQRKLPAFW